MTAGPIERALRFLKSTSVNCGAPEDGAGVTEADNGGVVLAGDAAAGEVAVIGADAGDDSSCANETERLANEAKIRATRVVISLRNKSWQFHAVEQAPRLQISVAAFRQRRNIVDLV
jgi:hypothetical protein